VRIFCDKPLKVTERTLKATLFLAVHLWRQLKRTYFGMKLITEVVDTTTFFGSRGTPPWHRLDNCV
jgi:hypothetical protein